MEKRNGMLYPMMVIAAISVILFSVVGIATMTGFIPNAQSQRSEMMPGYKDTASQQAAIDKSANELPAVENKVAISNVGEKAKADYVPAPVICSNCGVVESVRAHEIKGQGSAVGIVSGAVLGGIVGHQVGSGRGNDLATVAGAVGGGFAGHEVERNIKKKTQYTVKVRMEDDSLRTFTLNNPTVSVGEKVRVKNGVLVARN